MTALPHEQPSSRPRSLATGAVLTAVSLTLVFAHAVAAYWGFYHLGTAGGNGFALIILVIPVGLVVAVNVVFFVTRALVRRGASLARGLSVGALATVAVFAALLALEIRRTAVERSGEGPGAGDLAPYLFHHLGVQR